MQTWEPNFELNYPQEIANQMREWVMGLQEVESPFGDQNDVPPNGLTHIPYEKKSCRIRASRQQYLAKEKRRTNKTLPRSWIILD